MQESELEYIKNSKNSAINSHIINGQKPGIDILSKGGGVKLMVNNQMKRVSISLAISRIICPYILRITAEIKNNSDNTKCW